MQPRTVLRVAAGLASLTGVLAVSAWRPAPTPAEDDALALLTALRADLDGILRSATSNWRNSRWSVLAVSLDRGDTLFAVGSGDALAPASNLKLLTTAAAVDRLGTDFRFQTFLLSSGALEGNRLRGDIILYGTGDPGLSDRFHPSGRTVLESFADSLAQLGVQTIEGDLIGDGSYFSGPLLGEGWNPNDLNDSFAAPSAGLGYDENVFSLRLRRAADGSQLEIFTLPEGAGVPIDNQAALGTGPGLTVRREHPSQPILIRGRVPAGSREVWRQLTVPDPAHFAASVFRTLLEQRGVHVTGTVRSAHAPAESRVTGRRISAPLLGTQPTPRVLARHVSPPLHEYLMVVNKRSHNLIADHVFKTLGRVLAGEGSFAGGGRAVTEFLATSVGVDTSRVSVLDGSGLSTLNRVSAADFVSLMSYMANRSDFEAFWETLPEAGTRDLRRMSRTAAAGNLRAKTGTIRNVSALTGIVRTTNGERIAFSILSNAVPSTGGVKGVEDRIGSRLAAFGRPTPSDLAVSSALATSPDSLVGPGTTTVVAEASEPVVEETPVEVEGMPGREQIDGGGAAPAPAAETYRVTAGDNFTVIARRYGVPVNALLEANPQLSPRRLKVGTVVSIPARPLHR